MPQQDDAKTGNSINSTNTSTRITKNILLVVTVLLAVIMPPLVILIILSGYIIGVKKGFRIKSQSLQLLIFSTVLLVLYAVFFTFVAIPVTKTREHRMKHNTAIYNLRIVRQALFEYAKANDGKLPPAEKWWDELLSFDNKLSEANFKHPAMPNWGIAMNKNIAGMKLEELSDRIVLLLEAEGGRNLTADQFSITENTNRRIIDIILKDGTIQTYWLRERGIKKGIFRDRYVPVMWENNRLR